MPCEQNSRLRMGLGITIIKVFWRKAACEALSNSPSLFWSQPSVLSRLNCSQVVLAAASQPRISRPLDAFLAGGPLYEWFLRAHSQDPQPTSHLMDKELAWASKQGYTEAIKPLIEVSIFDLNFQI